MNTLRISDTPRYQSLIVRVPWFLLLSYGLTESAYNSLGLGNLLTSLNWKIVSRVLIADLAAPFISEMIFELISIH